MCLAKFSLKPTFILLLLCGGQLSTVSAEWFEGVGRYHQGKRTTEEEACRHALRNSKQNVFTKAGLEKFSSQSREMCAETGEAVSCKLYLETLNTYSGGYISEYTKEEKIEDGDNGRECVITIKADVKKYTIKEDANFALEASLNERTYRDGELLNIQGEVSKPSYLYALGYYPDIDSEYYYRIDETTQQVTGKFNFPAVLETDKEMITQFPPEIKKNMTFEEVIIVASKKKISILDKERIGRFRGRLEKVGRDQWTDLHLSYVILKRRK